MVEVTVTNAELLMVLRGEALTFKALDGQEVRLRMATAPELESQIREARRKLGLEPELPPEQGATIKAEAERLSRPIP